MDVPLEIAARDVDLTERNESLIRSKATGLGKYWSKINGCRVVIEGPGGHHRTGGPYKVRVELAVPGSDLVADRNEEEELDAAIHAAFNAAQRQLKDYARIRRREVKQR